MTMYINGAPWYRSEGGMGVCNSFESKLGVRAPSFMRERRRNFGDLG